MYEARLRHPTEGQRSELEAPELLEPSLEDVALDEAVADGLEIGDHGGFVLLFDGLGELGCVGRGGAVVLDGAVVGLEDRLLVDVLVDVLDDVLDEVLEDDGLDGDADELAVAVDDGCDTAELFRRTGSVEPTSRGGLVWRTTEPGNTRGRSAGSDDALVEDAVLPTPVVELEVVVVEVQVSGAALLVAGAEPARVLTGPAAPDPKSALRCANPMCSTTRTKPGTPLTAAATPEIDSVPTVIAATTPTRVRVCFARA